jgi:hypothetical protein
LLVDDRLEDVHDVLVKAIEYIMGMDAKLDRILTRLDEDEDDGEEEEEEDAP